MNVNRGESGRSMGTSSERASGTMKPGVAGRAIVLLALGCLLLGSVSRSRTSTANPRSQVSRSALQNAILSATSSSFEPAFEPEVTGQRNLDRDSDRNSDRGNSAQALAVLSHLPLLFEPNVGQANFGQSDSGVRFVARGSGYSLFLDSAGATLALRGKDREGAERSESVRMKLAGANRNARITGTDPLPGKSNYFLGNDPAQWHSDIPQFARVNYEDIYPGINLVFYGNPGQLEFDFQVAPGADPAQAQLEFDRSRKIELNSGTLTIKGENGSLRFDAPRIYQKIDGRRQPVEGRFSMRASNRVGFEVGAYDHSRELIIDPIPLYATYFGGTGNDTFPSVTVDILGNIFLTGSTTSANLPVSDQSQPNVVQPALNPTPNAQNIFVLKLNPLAGNNPTAIEYLTYLGGSGLDSSVGIGVDGNNIYVAGTTTSGNFPTTQNTAYQTTPKTGSGGGPHHAFVSVLNPTLTGTAQLTYSTYLSGSAEDIASGMTVDTNGNVYVTGITTSVAVSDEGSLTNAFPASFQIQPFQQITRGATVQFFVTKVNTQSAGIGSIAYSTYFGGGAPSNPCGPAPINLIACTTTVGGGIAVDNTGNIYFTGTTNFIYTGTSPTIDFPILNAYQPCLDQPPPNPNTNPQTCTNAGPPTATDAFVAKFNNPTITNQGTQLAWSTYFGGANAETGTGIAVDAGATNVYITGSTNSPNNFILPQTLGTFAPFQLCLDTPPPNPAPPCPTIATPLSNAYVARFNNPATGTGTTAPTIMALTYFSYLGGSGPDAALAITVDPASDALITGYTQSANFPTFPTTVIQPHLLSTASPPQNAFFARLNTAALQGQSTVGDYSTFYGGNGTDRGTSIAIDQNLNTYFAGDTTSTNLATLNPFQGAIGGGIDTFVVQLGTAADLAITNAVVSSSTTSSQIPVGTPISTQYTVTNEGPDLATNVVLLGTIPAGTTFNSASAQSGNCSTTVTAGKVACTISSLQSGSTSTVTIVFTANAPGNYTSSGSVSSANNIDPNPGNNNLSISFAATAFTISVTPSAVAVAAAGDSAFFTVTVTPLPVYGSGVSFGVTGLPAATKSTFSPSSFTLTSASPASSTLTISTTARPINIGNARPGVRSGHGALYAVFLTFPAMAFLGFGASGKSRRRHFAGLLLMCVLFGLIWLQPACGGGTTPPPQGGTPPGTYDLVITATGGNYSKNQTVQLVVP